MKPAFICEYCFDEVGTEEMIKQHELECEYNPNRDKMLYPTDKELAGIRSQCEYTTWEVDRDTRSFYTGCSLREDKEFGGHMVCKPTTSCPNCYLNDQK